MTRRYLVDLVDPLERITIADFFEPRKVVTLIRCDDGQVLKVRLTCSGKWKRGDVVDLEDFKLAAALRGAAG